MPFTNRLWGFHDTTLSRHVRFAYQALAIDEQRGLFEPTLWKQQPDATGQTLQQVWFAGVHSDVGGGYPDPSLAEIPLLWMTQRARECGLAFKPDYLQIPSGAPDPALRKEAAQIAPDPFGTLHNSRWGMYRLLPGRRRTMDPEGSARSAVASSAVRRLQEKPGYAPSNLEEYLATATPPVTGPRLLVQRVSESVGGAEDGKALAFAIQRPMMSREGPCEIRTLVP